MVIRCYCVDSGPKCSHDRTLNIATGKLVKQVVAGSFENKWMANAFKAFKTSGWPMLLILVPMCQFVGGASNSTC